MSTSDTTDCSEGLSREQFVCALSQQGSIGQLLDNHASSGCETNEIRQMRDGLQSQFDRIAGEFHSLVRSYPGDNAAKLVVSAICRRASEPHDAVLFFLVATHTELNLLADDFFDRALASYIAKRDAYDSIFKNLVPTRLRDRADDEMSRSSRRRKAVAANGWLPCDELFGITCEDQAPAYVATGLPKLDQAFQGWQGLTVIGGDRGTGKTTLMLWSARAALSSDPGMLVVFYSLDMSRSMLQRRLTCMEANVDFRVLNGKSRTPEVIRQLEAAHAKLCEEVYPRLCIVERSNISDSAGLTIESLMGLLGWFREQIDGAERVMFMFDLFQRITTPASISPVDADNYRLDLQQQLRVATRSPAQPEGAPIIVSSEIRKVDRRMLSHDDLLGTSRLSSDADAILLMWSTRNIDGKECLVEPLTVRIDKGRDGVRRVDIPLWFAHTRCQFSDEPPPQGVKGSSQAQNRQSPSTANIDPMAGR